MPVADDLRVIQERATRDLNAIHDFLEHSRLVWKSFEFVVDHGNTLSFKSEVTGTEVDGPALLNLAPEYTRGYLVTFTFKQFVSSFEAFLFDFLRRLLFHNPWQFAKSQLEFESVLRVTNRDEVIASVISKQLNDLKYDNLREWFIAVNKAVKLDCPSDDEIDSLAEIKAQRDILEHNGGIVNDTYLRKAGKKARYKAGDTIEITDDYHLESLRLIKKVIAGVTDAALVKVASP